MFVRIGTERVELDRETFEELVDMLRRAGLVVRDPKTGDVVAVSSMRAVSDKLTALRDDPGGEYAPVDEERGALAAMMQFWMNDVGLDKLSASAVSLLDLLRYGTKISDPE